MHKHPSAFGYKLVRASLNPSRSLANILRGHFPWWRDYEHPGEYQSLMVQHFQHAMQQEPREYADLFLHYIVGAQHQHKQLSAMSKCHDGSWRGGGRGNATISGYCCRYGSAARRKPRLVVEYRRFALDGKFWSAIRLFMGALRDEAHTRARLCQLLDRRASPPTAENSSPATTRNFNFSAVAALSTDVRFTKHLAFRIKTQLMLIRYKSTIRESRRNWNGPGASHFCRTIITSTPRTGA